MPANKTLTADGRDGPPGLLIDKRVAVMALGTFSVGTDGYVVAGILPRIGGSLGVPIDSAGLLVTVFALSYALLSPVLSSLTASWPRRRLLLTGLAVLAVGNVLTALAPTFALVLATRVLVGAGAAMYTPVASATASRLVPPEQRARAMAMVFVGLTVATAIGAPLGTLIGNLGSWRDTMWFVAALAIAASLGVALLMPVVPAPPPVRLRERLAPVKDARIALTLVTTFLLFAGLYSVYTYIAPAFARATDGSAHALVMLMVAWGLAATIGSLGSGRLTDRFGNTRVINVTATLALVDFAVMPFSTRTFPTALAAIIVWGVCGPGVLVPQQHRLVQISPVGAPLAIALNASAIYLALSASGLLGAAGIHLLGAPRLGLLGAALILAGLITAHVAYALIARRARARANQLSKGW